ncbi:MAG: IS3 family transposase [Actinomycetota bacterium]
MKANQAEHAVATMARLLEVSTSGYYDWLSRPDGQRTIDDRELTDRIRHHHAESRGTYGARRIHADLLGEGHEVGVKRPRFRAGLIRGAALG